MQHFYSDSFSIETHWLDYTVGDLEPSFSSTGLQTTDVKSRQAIGLFNWLFNINNGNVLNVEKLENH